MDEYERGKIIKKLEDIMESDYKKMEEMENMENGKNIKM